MPFPSSAGPFSAQTTHRLCCVWLAELYQPSSLGTAPPPIIWTKMCSHQSHTIPSPSVGNNGWEVVAGESSTKYMTPAEEEKAQAYSIRLHVDDTRIHYISVAA